MLRQLQKIGKAFMLPVSVLPIMALLVSFGNEHMLNWPFMYQAGLAVLGNLPLLFAIGVAVGLSKGNHGAAAVAGFVGYEVLTQGAIAINKDINMGVLGGIIAGVIAGWLYNRYHTTRLPDFLGFFGGRRLVPILTGLVCLVLSLVFGFIWPSIQNGLDTFGHTLTSIGAWGAALYGFFNRLLIPVGLHHVLNSYIWFMFGDYKGPNGVVHGDLTRFFAGDPTAGHYMAGYFPVFMFGLPGAAIAMIAAAKKGRRAAVAGVMLSAAFASFFTGITEPIEFAFMFVAPVLFVLHAILTAVSMGVVYSLGILHGFGFSAGAIDYFVNMNLAHRGWWLIPIGLVTGVVYFLVFYFAIKVFNLKTPGREDEGEIEASGGFIFDENQLAPKSAPAAGGAANASVSNKAADYLKALGGKENINDIEGCVTRLRLNVKSVDQLDEGELKRLGATGVMKMDQHNAQVVVGTIADMLAEEIQRLLK